MPLPNILNFNSIVIVAAFIVGLEASARTVE